MTKASIGLLRSQVLFAFCFFLFFGVAQGLPDVSAAIYLNEKERAIIFGRNFGMVDAMINDPKGMKISDGSKSA
jgi:hypothetical protein